MKTLASLAAVFLIPLTAHSGELEKLFDAGHPDPAEPSKASRPFAEVESEDHDITEIGLEHIAWYFGGAAVYTVVIKADGSFTYTGEKNVPHIGKYTGHIDTNDIKPLFQYVRDMDFFSLEDYYSTMATDQPTVFTMAARKGRKKIVKNYGTAGPLKLWALEKTISALIADATLTKVP